MGEHELERNLRAIASRGWRLVLAPPLRLGGAGILMAGTLEAEDAWQASAHRTAGGLVEAVGATPELAVAAVARLLTPDDEPNATAGPRVTLPSHAGFDEQEPGTESC